MMMLLDSYIYPPCIPHLGHFVVRLPSLYTSPPLCIPILPALRLPPFFSGVSAMAAVMRRPLQHRRHHSEPLTSPSRLMDHTHASPHGYARISTRKKDLHGP